MAKLLAAVGVAAIAVSIAGSSLALNPQPLPPRCLPGARCTPAWDRNHQGPVPYEAINNDWHPGGRIAQDDWRRGQHVDYRAHNLRPPPRGYEWREVNGNYVLAAVTTGVILSLLFADH